MNNQEVKQILNRIDQPKNKFLQYVTRWTNSIMGMALNVIALVIAVGIVFYYDNKQEVIFNSILLVAGLYILFYEVFDLAVLEYAITKDENALMVIIGGLITTSVFVYYVIFLNNRFNITFFDKLLLLISIYVCYIIFFGILLSEDKLFHIKFLYITNKCKYNKLFELVSSYFIRK